MAVPLYVRGKINIAHNTMAFVSSSHLAWVVMSAEMFSMLRQIIFGIVETNRALIVNHGQEGCNVVNKNSE